MIEFSTEITIAAILELGINKLESRCSISEETASATPPAAVNPFSLMIKPPMNCLPNSSSERTGVDKVIHEVLKYLYLQGTFLKSEMLQINATRWPWRLGENEPTPLDALG